jgi:hypothetical protein
MTQTYTLTHAIIENIKILNCDKDSYAIQMSNFLHCNVRAIMAWGGPLLNIYANKPNFHQGNSIFDSLYGYIKYDLSPVALTTGPYPVFIHKNDSASGTLTNLCDFRRLQINNPTGCTDTDYWTFVCWDLRYSTLSDLNFEGSNLQSHTMKVGSCSHLTFINYYGWEQDPGNAYVDVASNNEYITFVNPYIEDLLDSNHTDVYINPRIVGTINSDTRAAFIGLDGNSGTATLPSGQYVVIVSARFIGVNDYVLLTIIDSDAWADALKVEEINRAPTNTFVVLWAGEEAASVSITFYWRICHVP